MAEPNSQSNRSAPRPRLSNAQVSTTAIADAKISSQALSLQRQILLRQPSQKNQPAQLGPILQDWFKQHIQKPGKVLGSVTESWIAMVPTQLCDQTRLLSITRGVLHVLASNTVIAAELNIHLRQGLLNKLQNASKGAVFRVKITISSQL